MPTALFDNARFGVRVDAPNLVIMALFTVVPDTQGTRVEAFRGVTTTAHFKSMIDSMARLVNHYPKRETASPAT